jgi:hypothetical protein
VLKYPKEFYRNLIKLITYTNPINPFPSEAHQIERLMHTIFTSSYQPEKHMLDSNEFDEKIASIQPKLSKILLSNSSPRLKKVINFFELSAQSDEISILEIGIYQPSDMTRWGKILKNKFNLTGLGLADFKHNTPNGTYFSGSTLNRLDEILVEKNNFNLVIYEGNFFSGEALTLIEKIADKIHCQGFFALLDVPANYIFWMKKIIHLLKVKDVVFKIEFVEVDYLNEKQKIILITMKKNIFFNKQYYRLINYIELTKLRIMTKTY